MVLRKNTPQATLVPAPLSQAANNPPYPTTPADEHPPNLPSTHGQQELYSPDLNTSPAFNLKPVEEAQKQGAEDDDASDYSDDEWDKSDDDETSPASLPDPLKIGGGKPLPASANTNALPDALRAGPPPGVAMKRPMEISPEPTGATSSSFGAKSNASSGSIPLQTNNPYLKMQNTGQSNFGAESSEQVWGDAPAQAQKYSELVELPSFHTPDTPTNDMANLKLDSHVPPFQSAKSPDQPPLIAVESATPESAHPWQHIPTPAPAPAQAPAAAPESQHHGMDASSLDAFERTFGTPEGANDRNNSQQTWEEQQNGEQRERERQQREQAAAQEAADRERQHEEELRREQQATKFTPPTSSPFEEEHPPALPPRRSQEQHPPPMPPRPIDTGVGAPSHAGLESPNTVMNRQRKETYQIKHVRWHDVNKHGIRTSPILTQNINGPCPLLALVNALVLSTPSDVETALVETLRTREQVSLGLLLDAVFDELMSGRRGDAAQELPDVSELYKFLLALHSGLNVNPMFVQDPEATDGTSAHFTSLGARPGGFENTRDMRLYRTFNVPLMHGWLPEPGSEAYLAFERIAKTYETSQYVQFQEEELDAKLQSGAALNEDEQQMFTDIHAIKEFLNRWPTQLTTHGLRTMRESLRPGQVAILFRNDHFSTLYKDPRTDHLVTLVTDHGYSTHDEIVWESLVDVNGQGSELFSGDFRPIGNNSTPQRPQNQQPVQSLLDVDDSQGWTTMQSRRSNQQHSPSSNLSPSQNTAPLSPSSDVSRSEQEDHDLALALQLQEEEEDRHRRSLEERRRRENQLSEDAIAAQTASRPGNRRTPLPGEPRPMIPPRRNNQQTHRPSNEPAPPPTYEEAATNPPYHPPHGHPANPSAPVRPPGSAYQTNTQGMPPGQVPQGRRNSRPMMGMQNPMQGRPGRRQSAGVVGPNGSEDRDKCVVM
ncbi:hypothetical protein BU26DRAFT_516139 [Trematosphaeria pertusa]|uniref:MINDY deubiquitinase domain-containing protein n=1 Tax=Trematosphaeria pertusa TaxID=390896 RepID=A0A6A6ITY2_9PLEO|nr:uncharacterized protein BU26DRAFT_516139 [Trematosphaeria pertusa]KAF2253866.1 hypothetical protein BU26DRAFT_516139 [Trematosphaeria pertusa]